MAMAGRQQRLRLQRLRRQRRRRWLLLLLLLLLVVVARTKRRRTAEPPSSGSGVVARGARLRRRPRLHRARRPAVLVGRD